MGPNVQEPLVPAFSLVCFTFWLAAANVTESTKSMKKARNQAAKTFKPNTRTQLVVSGFNFCTFFLVVLPYAPFKKSVLSC